MSSPPLFSFRLLIALSMLQSRWRSASRKVFTEQPRLFAYAILAVTLVAAFATRGLCADVVRLTLAGQEMVVSETVLTELARALGRKIGLPDREARSIVSFVRQQATLAPEASGRSKVRDPKDAPILAAALACGADVLVTGDRVLLELDQPVGIRIVSPRGFWQLVKAPPNG